jgi:hypothetical protein
MESYLIHKAGEFLKSKGLQCRSRETLECGNMTGP